MANTYTQIHIQFVFVVKYREGLIDKSWKDELYKYITGIVQSKENKHKLIAINGMPDHIHLLVGFRTTQTMADFMQDVKGASSKWINENKKVKGHFEWQAGFGAFSYSKSHLKNVINYIGNQEEHHRNKTFLKEYVELLEEFEVEYEDRYIFKELI